jgi:D-alanyl-lipoteichoic acid acyltransferase DltB (MBOAT superfamily)
MYAFAWQIYGDFSGYSDIARGSAQLLGFHFMVNFRQPYLARSMQDFWRRWHISLSTWLRDYLYIPLGGSRNGERQTYRNLFATMLLGGLWHGANWTFVIWGGIHGSMLAVERWFNVHVASRWTAPGQAERRTTQTLFSASAWLQRIIVFHLVGIAWVFFRAVSLGDATTMLAGARTWSWRPEYLAAFKFLAVFTIPLFLIDLHLEATEEEYVFAWRSYVPRFAVAATFLIALTLFAATDASAFIYFQF